MVDSGDTVGQWHDLSEFLCDLAIDIKAGMVLGAYLMGQ
jgi:WD40 repeat protein